MPASKSPRRTSILIGISLFVAMAAGCDLAGPDDSHFPETRLYAHDFFNSYAECEAAQPGGVWINCSMTLVLCPTGAALYTVTDIVHVGSYVVEGSDLTVRVPANPEIPDEIRFELSGDGDILTHLESGLQWERREGSDHKWAETTCEDS